MAQEGLTTARLRLVIRGKVQGVGFRPSLYRMAQARGLLGTLANTDAGVVVDLEGPRAALRDFFHKLPVSIPPHAELEEVTAHWPEPEGKDALVILASVDAGARGARIPADLATCDECLEELRDPADRRGGYAFINCTNCGPRFTIVSGVPYDRPKTTMAVFDFCPDCEAEYGDPGDRRYHAEPVACPVCGPALALTDAAGVALEGDPVERAAALLAEGKVLAVKGLGGFHLAADARSEQAVVRLRQRKGRADKPFAVMVRDLRWARRVAVVEGSAEALLRSAKAPIVLLPRAEGTGELAEAVAPGSDMVGLMLPYTPLHHLLLARLPALVMTSGNFSEEPIATDNGEARERLASLADAFLQHDRKILVACEDSVVRPMEHGPVLIRRSRGYAPDPVPLPVDAGCTLAVGGQLKNTFCLTHGREAFLGPHVGDLESPESQDAFVRAVEHLAGLLRLEPEAVVHDAHPDYVTTRHALSLGLPARAVQHHHAHVAAVAGDQRVEGPVLGLALDGTGYGDDDTVWGGELLLCPQPGSYERLGHLRSFPLPGGEACVRRPARTALGLVHALLGAGAVARALPHLDLSAAEADAMEAMIERRTATVTTSSCGRLFDAVAALCGLGHRPTFEGQPAMMLELAAGGQPAEPYPVDLDEATGVLDPAPALDAMLDDRAAGVAPAQIAARFHRGLAEGLARQCAAAALAHGLGQVVLGGGCFQNRLLVRELLAALSRAGIVGLLPTRVPPNDGGLAYGQAVVHGYMLANGQ